jgi:hypothetical protein
MIAHILYLLVFLARIVTAAFCAFLAVLLLVLGALLDHEAPLASAALFVVSGALAYSGLLLARGSRRRERETA